MKSLKIGEILPPSGGTLVCGDLNTVFGAVNTDSRTIQSGDLFVPLVGERFDGHDYVLKALEQGAVGALVSRDIENFPADKACIRVKDTRVGLKNLASYYRSLFSIPFIQITGSVGKTTTKEMIGSVLDSEKRTLKTKGNFNNDIGTPLTIFGLEDRHEVAVIETGMDHFGEIRYLGEIVRPDIAVITNIGDAHIENLGSREGILQAKSEIFENLSSDGVAVLNGDDDLLNTVSLPQKIIRYGKGDNCDIRILEIKENNALSCSFVIKTSLYCYNLTVNSPGAHMAYAAAAAIGCGEALGIEPQSIVRGVEGYEPCGSRMNMIHLKGNRVVIDDCYNANPQSMESSLRVLALSKGKKIAVLGDMLCLGDIAVESHRHIGELCRNLGIDIVCGIGDLSAEIVSGAGDTGHHYDTNEEALKYLKNHFDENSTMLVKASHGMHLEEIVEGLKREF